MRGFLGENGMMAYLAMMAIRLLELHRVLKPSGSLYLHCDPTASHDLKLLLDGVFGAERFLNEVIWKRTSAHDFKPDGRKTEKALVSVKGGDNVGVQMIRDLHSTMEREKAPIGVFLTKALPTSVMEREAAAVGRFTSDATGRSCARLQIITLAELFAGKKPDMPYVDATAGMKRAGREDMTAQDRLL